MLIHKWISTLIGICAWGGVHISSAKRRTTKSFKAHLSGVCQKWHNHWVMSSPVLRPEVASLYKMQWSLICHHIPDHKCKSQLTCDREGPILLATSTESCFYLGLLFYFIFVLFCFWSTAISNRRECQFFIFCLRIFDICFILFLLSFHPVQMGLGRMVRRQSYVTQHIRNPRSDSKSPTWWIVLKPWSKSPSLMATGNWERVVLNSRVLVPCLLH